MSVNSVCASFGTASLWALSLIVVATLVSYGVTRCLLLPRVARALADQPNARSLHTQPVPRAGGLGIMAAMGLTAPLICWDGVVVSVALALALVSLIDDLRGLPVAVRFGAHGLAAAVVLMHWAPPWPWGVTLAAAVAIVWSTNLYNFMDGSDGLAGGMALFGFGAYAVVGWLGGASTLALTCAVLAAAAAAYLVLNFPPARVFMGDAGSIPLGFLAAAIGCAGVLAGLWPVWFPLLVFSPFVVDASVTIVKRLLRGERVWQAHRTHYYQRMVQIGWGHTRVALIAYGIMALASAAAIAALMASPGVRNTMLIAITVTYIAFGRWFDRRWAKETLKKFGDTSPHP